MKPPAVIVLAAMLGVAWSIHAQVDVDASAIRELRPGWTPPAWWNVTPRESSGVVLGNSDFRVTGPLVDTFQYRPRRRSALDRSLGEKLLNLPIISLFVPQPIPKPGGSARVYFAWGDRENAWSNTADRPIPGPVGGLISVTY